MDTSIVIWIGLSAVLSAGLMPLCALIAYRSNVVSYPRSDRWNNRATPLLGGIGIWIALTVTLIVSTTDGLYRWQLFGAAIVFAAGLADDIRSIHPLPKLIAMSIGILSPLLYYSTAVNSLSPIHIAIIYLWTVFFINSTNLLDNMNGLCSASMLIACLFLSQIPALEPDSSKALLILSGALAGFLPFNFPKAKLFMGDAGSLVIGYWVGVHSAPTIIVEGNSLLQPDIHAIAALTFLILPICDTIFVSITRRLRGQRISIGGNDHLSHRLAMITGDATSAVMILLAVQLMFSIAAVIILYASAEAIVLYAAIIFLLTTIAVTILYKSTQKDLQSPR